MLKPKHSPLVDCPSVFAQPHNRFLQHLPHWEFRQKGRSPLGWLNQESQVVGKCSDWLHTQGCGHGCLTWAPPRGNTQSWVPSVHSISSCPIGTHHWYVSGPGNSCHPWEDRTDQDGIAPERKQKLMVFLLHYYLFFQLRGSDSTLAGDKAVSSYLLLCIVLFLCTLH